jgi:hypothetical protein
MSRSVRKVGARQADKVTCLPGDELIENLGEFPAPETAPSKPADPARVAAWHLLQRAAEAASTTLDVAALDGAVCIVTVPAVAWVEITCDAWRSHARAGQRYADGTCDRAWIDGDWYAWSPTEALRKQEVLNSAEVFSKAVSRGRHCIGFAAEPDWLPADLVQAADYRLTVPTPSAADVDAIVAKLCDGAPSDHLDDEQAATLTPRLLRLARRPGQTADAYVAKMRDLLLRDPAAEPAVQARSFRDGPTLDTLPGMRAATTWGRDLARDLAAYRAGSLAWSAIDRGVLLYGPPGTGKTTFARALAAHCDVPLVIGSLGQWQAAGHLGDMLKAMRTTFDAARKASPAILFVDEVDGFGDRSSFTHEHRDYSIQVVNGFLELLDGVTAREGVVVVAACNHRSRLDPAIVRSGRLDRSIEIPLPDHAALAQIIRVHLGDDLADQELAAIPLEMLGGTGADCERYVRGARRRARNAGRPMVLADLQAEVRGEERVRSTADSTRVAYHEAGNALVAAIERPGSVMQASVRSRGSAAGSVCIESGMSALLTARELEICIRELLAGRAAEEIALGNVSAGSGGGPESDLARATTLAAMMEMAFGLGDAGPVWLGIPSARGVASALTVRPDVGRRVAERIAAVYADAVAFLREHQAPLDAIAAASLEQGILSGEEIQGLIDGASSVVGVP